MAEPEQQHDAEAIALLRSRPDLLGAVYQAADARRSAIDQMMWQAPGLSLTAQAFLLTVALQTGTAPLGRLVAGLLGLVAALAAMQLLAKHRHHEVQLSRWLERLERMTLLPRLNDPSARADLGSASQAHKWRGSATLALAQRLAESGSSFSWWLRTLAVFGAVDVFAILLAITALIGLWNPLAG